MAILTELTLAELIDDLWDMQQERYEAQRELKNMVSAEASMKREIEKRLSDVGVSGAEGNKARATVSSKAVPHVTDWEALHEYVRSTGEFELLQKRVLSGAVAERWSVGEEIPGVEQTIIYDLRVKKA